MRIALVMLFIGAPIWANAADTKQETLNAVAFRLTTAYQCAHITGDGVAYEKAKEAAPAMLADAGITDRNAMEIIAAVESQGHDGSGKLTKELCSTLLASFK